jgi:hypothetical protein
MARGTERRPPLDGHLIDGIVRPGDLDEPSPPLARLSQADRVALVRALRPPQTEACRDCWIRGREAAIRALTAAQPIEAVEPGAHERHVLRSFESGRDAARALLEIHS